MNTYRIALFLFGILLFGSHVKAQINDSLQDIETRLYALSNEVAPLNEVISISVSGASIEEFLRGVANNSGLNINVAPGLDISVVNNFTNVKVVDILIFICKQYNLSIENYGNILTIYKADIFEEVQVSRGIIYDSLTNQVTIDYKSRSLEEVAKEITMVTGKNVVFEPGLEQLAIRGYVQRMPFDNALDKLAFSNDLTVTKTEDNFYVLKKNIQQQEEETYQYQSYNNQSTNRRSGGGYQLDIIPIPGYRVTVHAANAPVSELIKQVSSELGLNYSITGELNELVTINIENQTYVQFLDQLLNTSQYTYRLVDSTYIIGERSKNELLITRTIPLQYRTVDKITEVIPQSLTEGLEIIESPDLNLLFVSGPLPQINKLEAFIKEIDKSIPVIMIEVTIVYMNKNFIVSTGIQAGLGEAPVQTTGQIYPGLDIQLGSETINKILGDLNGLQNLGVQPNFYVVLKALEAQGFLDVSSTPMLSTLSGQEASMSIGQTEYYLEEKTNLIGTQNPQVETTQSYVPVEAKLALKIKPIVSGNDQITLEIEVSQSDFTERITKEAPPGNISRDFKSQIRIKNQEMIVLGGLEEKRVSETASGMPVLSRIPVLKWIFSSRTKENSNTRLNIFIKPTIIN